MSSNMFLAAFTPGRAVYAEAAIKGMDQSAFQDPIKQKEYIWTKTRIEAWPLIKEKALDLASRVLVEFDPLSSALDHVSSELREEDMLRLRSIIRTETIARYRLDQWQTDVQHSIEQIEAHFAKIKVNTSTIDDLRTAVRTLVAICSGKGYFSGN